MLGMSQIPHLLVNFTIQDIQIDQAIWVDDGNLVPKSYFGGNQSFSLKNALQDLISAEQLQFTAERYATGLLAHGGGARVGNIQGLQIKGIGPNILTNSNAPIWYSYGGMSLIDGILDCIISKILLKIHPELCVPMVGILATNSTGGLYCDNITKEKLSNYKIEDYHKVWGGLLLRNAELRPAHFMPSQGFSETQARNSNIPPESIRIHDTWLYIISLFPTAKSFLNWLMDFSDKSIENLGLAHAYGIFHGGLTPSNISMDGKWIDINQVQYSDSHSPTLIDPAEELKVVLKTIKTLIYLYRKYSSINIEDSVLLNHYQNKYYSIKNEAQTYNLSICDLNNDYKNVTDDQIIQAGLKALRETEKNVSCKSDTTNLIRALKNLMLSQTLMLGAVRDHLWGTLFAKGIQGVKSETIAYLDWIDWIFNVRSERINIFKTRDNEMTVTYSLKTREFILESRGVDLLRNRHISEVLANYPGAFETENVVLKIFIGHLMKSDN